METRNFANIQSTAVSDIAVTGNDVVITFKSSGKQYNYRDTTGNFVNLLENTIESNQSVGTMVNKAIKEDKTLELVAI
jgi:hypothetical protein